MILWSRGFLSTSLVLEPPQSRYTPTLFTFHAPVLLFPVRRARPPPTQHLWARGGHMPKQVCWTVVCVPSTFLSSGDTEQSLVCEEQVVNAVSKLCELSLCLNQGLYTVTFLCKVAFAFKGGRFKTVGVIHFRINWKSQKRGTTSVLAPRKNVSKAFQKLSRLQFSQARIFRNAEFFQRPSREESF